MLRHLAVGLAALATGLPGQGHEVTSQAGPKVSKLLTQELHPGEEVTVVLLEFPPGATSQPHRHPGPVFLYIIAGTVQTQIEGGPLTTLHAGEVFYEPTGALHSVARNPSTTEPAKAIAFVVGAKGAPPTAPA